MTGEKTFYEAVNIHIGLMIEFRKVMTNQIEFRFDPLTEEQTRTNPERAKRLKQAEGDIRLEEIISKSRETCVFCPEQIEEKTPKFPEADCKEGRIRIGETTVFPNLNPFGENHAVGTLSEGHFLDLDEFKADLLRDNLLATKNYILSVNPLCWTTSQEGDISPEL